MFHVKNNQSNTLRNEKYTNYIIKITSLKANNGPVGWIGLTAKTANGKCPAPLIEKKLIK